MFDRTVTDEEVSRERIYRFDAALTLIELLVTIAIICILATLLLSAIAMAKGKAQRTFCMNDLRQIALGVRMYSDDSRDRSPSSPVPTRYPYSAYKALMKSYVGSRSAKEEKLFTCPADTFYYDFSVKWPVYVSSNFSSLAASDYSSYLFNSGNKMKRPNGQTRPGIAGADLNAIKHPSRTLLVFEAPAVAPYSWHKPKWPRHPVYFLPPRRSNCIFNDAMNMATFVDGHASYVAFYWQTPSTNGILAADYDPPAQYNYQWSGN